MRPYRDWKKLFNFLILTAFFIFLPVLFSLAQTATDVQNKINQKNADIAALEREIASYQGQLDALGQQKNTLRNSLAQLDLSRKQLNADIAITQKKIDRATLTISNLSKDITAKQMSIDNNQTVIAEDLRNIDESESSNFITGMLATDNFATVWDDLESMANLRESVRKNTLALRSTKATLEDTRQVNIDTRNQLAALKSQLGDQQKIIIQNTIAKNKLLAQTKNSESNYQQLLNDRIAQRDAFEKELENYEAQLQYILDPSKLPAGRVLSWPLQNVFVTQLFGKTVAAKRLYATGTHNGVDFRAATGTPVMAMADGTVLGVGDTDRTCYGASFGKFVFIKFNNGLSATYGHLSLPKVSEGERVQRGQVVGYSGATGHVTGPHLHISLYAGDAAKMASKPSAACGGRVYYLPVAPMNAYLNVLDYLPPYTGSIGAGGNTSE